MLIKVSSTSNNIILSDIVPPTVNDPYAAYRGTVVYSIIGLPAFKESVQAQLKMGLIDTDDRLRVRYSSPGAPFWAIWTDQIGYFTLAEIEEIWGFDYDLELYENNKVPAK